VKPAAFGKCLENLTLEVGDVTRKNTPVV